MNSKESIPVLLMGTVNCLTSSEYKNFVVYFCLGSRIEDNERSARLRRSCDCWTTLGRCMSSGSRQCYFVNGPSIVKCVGDSGWKRVRRCQSGCVWNNDNPYCT